MRSGKVVLTRYVGDPIHTVLLQHQKSKHYRCPQCPRRLNTAGGLSVHLTQVHKAQPDKYVAAKVLTMARDQH